jgi:hypothetical protein
MTLKRGTSGCHFFNTVLEGVGEVLVRPDAAPWRPAPRAAQVKGEM